jgi:hypothetical protein
MTAALKPQPRPSHTLPISPKCNRGVPREVSNELILDAARTLIAQGLKPTAPLIAETVTHITASSISAYLKQLRRQGLLPRWGDGLSCPTMARRFDGRTQARLDRMRAREENAVPAEPCARCGTTGGYTPPDYRKPARHSADGYEGMVCRRCYLDLQAETRGAGPTLLFVEETPATQDALRVRASEIRDERGTEVSSMDNNAERGRWSFGLAAEREVAWEQTERLLRLRSKGVVGESAREGARIAVEKYDAAWRRLRGWDPMARKQEEEIA